MYQKELIRNHQELAIKIYRINKNNGFWDKERNLGEMLMLVVSELGEAIEAHRKGRFANQNKFLKDFESAGMKPLLPNFGFKSSFEDNIKDTFEDEICDTLIRLYDMCGGLGINLEGFELYKSDYHFNYFWENEKNVGACLMLVTAQLNNAILGYYNLNSIQVNKVTNKANKLIQKSLLATMNMLYKFAEKFNIDIDWHMKQKLKYNATRKSIENMQGR